ncbi:MAG: Crp/Fnr family transcriptional regulator [Clostridiaceae bacterium]|nr:Crp/Fnr family transcriptional regulator [Clostridiaceae bacterium]MBW4858941.1 Crp/Fnr family transcriptional regulator [Clostridiaceae bacterium]MBW4869516.1 Crp/Fnr family transcriptional regulator [Clostridiaceae bacterium]
MVESIKKSILKLSFFTDLDREYINYLAESSFRVELKKGESLFSERDEVKNIYMILEGKMTLFRLSEIGQKRIIYILDSGEIINEVIFDNMPASINCEAFEDSIVIGFGKETLLYVMEKNFDLTQKVIKSMGKKIRRQYRQLKNTVPIRMDKKLAAKLWKLSRDYGIGVEGGVLINLDLSITYLADMLGSTRETVSRCMSDLKKENLVEYRNGKILVKDRKKMSIYFRGV